MTVFNRETKILGDRYRMVEQTSWAAGVAGLLLLFVAVLATGSLGKNVKAVLILSSTFLSAGGAIVATELTDSKRKLYEGAKRADEELLKRQMEARFAVAEQTHKMIYSEQLLGIISRLPPHRQAVYLQQTGLGAFLQQQAQMQQQMAIAQQPAITVPAQAVPTRAQSTPVDPVQQRDWEAIAREKATSAAIPPERNLAIDIADTDGHVGIVSKSGSGKTTVQVQAIAYDVSQGKEVYVIDGKGDARLQAIPGVHYLQANSVTKYPAAVAMVESLLDELETRQTDPGAEYRAIAIYIDENNLIRAHAKHYKEDGWDGNKRDDKWWGYATMLLLLQGRAANMRLRISAHTSRVEDWGWNTGVLDSLSFIALARGAYESIDDLIRHQVDGEFSDQYKAQVKALKASGITQPIALSLLTPQGLCSLPQYQDPSFEGGAIAWHPESETEVPDEAVNPYEAIALIQRSERRTLTDEEIEAYWEHFTGRKPTPDQVPLIRKAVVKVNAKL